MSEEERKPWSRPRRKRLGDKVKQILEPVVEIIDNTLKTDLKHCASCEERRKLLNRIDEKLTNDI